MKIAALLGSLALALVGCAGSPSADGEASSSADLTGADGVSFEEMREVVVKLRQTFEHRAGCAFFASVDADRLVFMGTDDRSGQSVVVGVKPDSQVLFSRAVVGTGTVPDTKLETYRIVGFGTVRSFETSDGFRMLTVSEDRFNNNFSCSVRADAT